MSYWYKVGSALSQLGGALTGYTLNSNESISGAAWRRKNKVLVKVINTLFFWQDNHCKQAAINEVTACQNLLVAYGIPCVSPSPSHMDRV